MKRVLLLFLGVAVAVGLAAYLVPAPAARVDGSTVSRRSLDSDLSAIAGSADFQCYLSEQESLSAGRRVTVQVSGVVGNAASTKVYDTAFVDRWLGQRVDAQATAQALAQRGVSVTAGDLQVGRSVLERRITGVLSTYARDTGATAACGGSGKAVLASMPARFVNEQVRAQTDQSLLEAKAAGAGLQGDQVATYYAAHQAEFDKYCLSVIVLNSKTKAVQVAAAIKGGASFAKQAKANSVDATTASKGGAAGCGILAGSALLAPIEHLAVDHVSTPIAYNGTYLLAEVTSRAKASYTAVATTVMTVMLLAGQQRADAEVQAVLGGTGSASVDARYGHLKPGTSQVLAPSHPPLSSLLTAQADTPAGG